MGSVPKEVDLGKISGEFDTALTIAEGDTLVLITDRRMTTSEITRGTEMLQQSIPGVKVVVVQGFQQALVYRPREVAVAPAEYRDA